MRLLDSRRGANMRFSLAMPESFDVEATGRFVFPVFGKLVLNHDARERMDMKRTLWAATLSCALMAAYPAKATDFTLTDSAIMSLDYDNRDHYPKPLTASLVSKQDTPGTGVTFIIRFASTNSLDALFFRLADRNHGARPFAGLDARAYKSFALKFTLVSIDGSTSGSETLGVGAVVGPSQRSSNAFRPKPISLTGSDPRSAVSTTLADPGFINVVGFTVYQSPEGWRAGPHEVTLLVQPADGAVPLEIPRR